MSNYTYTKLLRTRDISYGADHGEVLAFNKKEQRFVPTKLNDISGIEKTHAELLALKNSSGLTPGQTYLMTDYQTIHTIRNTTALNVHGTTYEVASAWTNTLVEGVEPLILTATDVNKFDEIVRSKYHEYDIIKYAIDNFGTNGNNKKGTILRRVDTARNIDCVFDWRYTKTRRWAVSATTWDAQSAYTSASTKVYQYNNAFVYVVSASTGATPLSYVDGSPILNPAWEIAYMYENPDIVKLYGSRASKYLAFGPSTNFPMYIGTIGATYLNVIPNDYKDFFTFNKCTGSTEALTTVDDFINGHNNINCSNIQITGDEGVLLGCIFFIPKNETDHIKNLELTKTFDTTFNNNINGFKSGDILSSSFFEGEIKNTKIYGAQSFFSNGNLNGLEIKKKSSFVHTNGTVTDSIIYGRLNAATIRSGFSNNICYYDFDRMIIGQNFANNTLFKQNSGSGVRLKDNISKNIFYVPIGNSFGPFAPTDKIISYNSGSNYYYESYSVTGSTGTITLTLLT